MAYSPLNDQSKSDNVTLDNILKARSGSILLDVLKSIEGQKDLILEGELTSILDQILNVEKLKSADVNKIYKLEAGPSPGNTYRCVYLVRPTTPTTRIIIEQIILDQQRGNNKNRYWIIYLPKKLTVCEKLLEQEGVYEYVTVKEFPSGLIPQDTDLFSLEAPDFFSSFYQDGDCTWIPTLAASLLDVQRYCGTIEHVYGHGRCSKMVYELMCKLKQVEQLQDSQDVKPLIGSLILIDRDADYASLFLSQMTYEGLLDEIFGIKSGKVMFGEDVTGRSSEKPIKLAVNSSDPVFLEIRDRHFSTVFNTLKEKALHLKSKNDERQGMQITDLKKFVSTELKNVQKLHSSLSLHIGASEVIMKHKSEDFEQLLETEQALLENISLKECISYIEDCIIKKEPVWNSLRWLCLLSVTQDGLSTKDYRSLVTHFLQSYGHDHIVTLHILKKLGLLLEQTPPVTSMGTSPSGNTANKLAGKFMAAVALRKSSFTLLAKKLGLIPESCENYNYLLPPNAGYVFSGTYIPLICRISEQITQGNTGWFKIKENLKQLTSETFYCREPVSGTRQNSQIPIDSPGQRTVLVCFLGGVTFAEIAGLRYLGKQTGYTFLIATTSLTSFKTLFQDFIPKSL